MITLASEKTDSEVEWIATGLTNLDKILGGGIPTRRITEVSGPFSVGKTTLALMVIAAAQANGYKTLWVDQEWAWEEKYAESLGVSLKKLFLVQERFAETALDDVEEWAEKNKNAVIVIDAVGALLPRQEAEKDNQSKTIGGQAGLVAKFCRKIVPLLSMNNIALVVLNHEFTDIMSGRIMTSGGKKLEYHKSVWLKLRKANKRLMQGERQVGEVITAEIRKNKVAPTMKQETDLQLFFGVGFNKEADLLDQALEKSVIVKNGQTYFYGEQKLGRISNVREWLKEHGDKISTALSGV